MPAMSANLAMDTTLSLSAEACSTFVIGILGCLDDMLGQWFSSCGRQTYMGVAKYVTDCLGVYYDTDPERSRASEQP